jgi:hypothetical protein
LFIEAIYNSLGRIARIDSPKTLIKDSGVQKRVLEITPSNDPSLGPDLAAWPLHPALLMIHQPHPLPIPWFPDGGRTFFSNGPRRQGETRTRWGGGSGSHRHLLSNQEQVPWEFP